MLQYIVYFVTLINPVAIFVYLLPLKQARGINAFTKILIRASLATFLIYAVFALFGEQIFTDILRVDFRSFRIFGGLVLLGISLNFLVYGKRRQIKTKGEDYEIAAQVALPYMVGTGTLTMSIIMGRALGKPTAILIIGAVIAISFAIILILALIRQGMKKNVKLAFDRNLDIFMRLNGFFVGTIGVDLVIKGVQGFF
jgi:multiple antibiotic resistance protein